MKEYIILIFKSEKSNHKVTEVQAFLQLFSPNNNAIIYPSPTSNIKKFQKKQKGKINNDNLIESLEYQVNIWDKGLYNTAAAKME